MAVEKINQEPEIWLSTKFNRKIISSKHAFERYEERFENEIKYYFNYKQEILDVIEKAMDKIINEKNDKSSQYGIYSVSTGIGLIIEWKKLFLQPEFSDNYNHAEIITILPRRKKKPHFRPTDIEIIVEKLITEWGIQKIPLLEKKNFKKKNYVYVVNEDNEFYAVFLDGKLYDYTTLKKNFIIVD